MSEEWDECSKCHQPVRLADEMEIPAHRMCWLCCSDEVTRLRGTAKTLNRRCQKAESAARTKVDEVLRAGPSLGRALSGWAAGDYKRRLATMERWYKALRKKAEWALRGLEQLAKGEAEREKSTFKLCDYTFAKGLRGVLDKQKPEEAPWEKKEGS